MTTATRKPETWPATLRTVPCPRCGGTGIHIAHPHQGTGTACFKCGGAREMIDKRDHKWVGRAVGAYSAIVGDHMVVGTRVYIVEHIEWCANGWYPSGRGRMNEEGNQRLILRALEDGAEQVRYRAVYGDCPCPDGDCPRNAHTTKYDGEGGRRRQCAITVTPEMIGQSVEEVQE